MGGARVPYAGVIEYGNPHRNIPASNYLNDARERERSRILSTFEAGIDRIIRANGLE
jgi:hypothetical protein